MIRNCKDCSFGTMIFGKYQACKNKEKGNQVINLRASWAIFETFIIWTNVLDCRQFSFQVLILFNGFTTE